MKKRFEGRNDVNIFVTECDPSSVPIRYRVDFRMKSICGVDSEMKPLFADRFAMDICIPERYPQADAPVQFRFVGDTRPWHPNIVYYGDMAGSVCVNQLNSFTGIAWGVERVEEYLKYTLYHAEQTPPFPTDLKVAEWVRRYGEPGKWIFFDQD